PWSAGGFRGVGLFPQHQGGQYLVDAGGVLGVVAGELRDGGALPLPEGFDELVGDLPEGVRSRRIDVVHPQTPSMPPGMPWKTSLSRLRARTWRLTAAQV